MLAVCSVLGALLAVANAQSTVLSFTSVPNPVTDGQPQAITYRTNDTITPVTITLRQGSSANLNTLYNLTTPANGNQYIWTPRTDLPNGDDYALQITQGDQTNYYGPFRVQGYMGPLSSSSMLSSASNISSGYAAATGAYGSAGTIGTMSMGTASAAMSRNTTFSVATLLATTTSTATTTTSQVSVSPTGSTGAADAVNIGSSFAFAGALAALLMP